MIRQLHSRLLSCSAYRVTSRKVIRRVRQLFGCPEPWGLLISILQKHPEAVYLDVGAFDGSTIERILDECPNPIHAFEPTRETFSRLRARHANNPRVTFWNLALSDQVGPIDFHINANKQTNSLLANDWGNQAFVGADTRPEGMVQVQGTTLDHSVSSHLSEQTPFVMKCDVQGAEGLVITGGKESIKRQCLALYTEAQLEPMYVSQASFAQIQAALTQELGLALHQVYPCLHDATGRALQFDVLYLRLPSRP
jgi:FkbM family methyltransferase